MIKIVLIEDHQLLRTAIREILENTSDMAIAGEAATGQEGIESVDRLKPDVVLLDLMLPDFNGLLVTQKLLAAHPDLKILVVSGVVRELSIFRLLEAGARGYAPKHISGPELIVAIKTVHEGNRYIYPPFARQLALMKTDLHEESIFSQISGREMTVLEQTIRGISVKDIAKTLKIGQKTVHSYRDRIFKKLGVNNDVEVMLLAEHYHLIKLEDIEI